MLQWVRFCIEISSFYDVTLLIESLLFSFGDGGANRCGNLRADQYDVYPLATNSKGYLTYEPSVSGAAAVVDELALLLTAGRLSPDNKALLEDAYSNLNGLESALKLITTTPEFHTTNSVNKDAGPRPSASVQAGESSDYKSVGKTSDRFSILHLVLRLF